MDEFVRALQKRGVAFEVVNGKLRCRGVLSADEQKRLSENAQLVAAILCPDVTLPDEIVIPHDLPNNVIAIADHINKQRKQVAA